MIEYAVAYSNDYSVYFVAKVLDDKTCKLMWKCKDQEHAIEFANALNTGTVLMCRGCKILGTACGHCIKCKCT